VRRTVDRYCRRCPWRVGSTLRWVHQGSNKGPDDRPRGEAPAARTQGRPGVRSETSANAAVFSTHAGDSVPGLEGRALQHRFWRRQLAIQQGSCDIVPPARVGEVPASRVVEQTTGRASGRRPASSCRCFASRFARKACEDLAAIDAHVELTRQDAERLFRSMARSPLGTRPAGWHPWNGMVAPAPRSGQQGQMKPDPMCGASRSGASSRGCV